MGKYNQAQMFFDFLVSEGYRPEIDEDGDVLFRREGRVYLILVDEDDDEFFRLVFPNFWSIDNEFEREKAEKAALYASAKTKVAKVFTVRDNVWASIEMFCSPLENFKPVFERSIRALNVAVQSFAEKMREPTDL